MSKLTDARVASTTARTTHCGRRRWPTIAAVGLALALVASACGGDDDDEGADGTTEATVDAGGDTTAASGVPAATTAVSGGDTSATPAGEGEPGGSLTYASNTFPASLDPLTISARVSDGGMYGYPIYGSLIDVDYDTTSVVTMNFAKSLETTDDGKTWTLVLNEGITFTDGEPYDADAVKFNWDRYKAEAPLPSPGAQRMESVTVVDPLTLEVTLTEPTTLWPTIMGALIYVGSPKAITEMGDAFATAPVGAGPFMIDEWVSDTSMTVVRNPDYWEAGLPYLDELTIISIPDPTRRVDGLISGELDIALSRPDLYDQLEGAGLAPFASPNNPAAGGSGWVFNATAAPFDDRELRCALVQSVDKDAMNDQLASGNAIGHEDGSVYQEFLHRGPSAEGHVKLPPADHDAAQAAFDAYAEANGGPLEFTILAIDSSKLEVDYYLTQWSTYENLEVTVEYGTVPEVITKASAKDYDMAQLGMGSGDLPAGFGLNQYIPQYNGFTSPELDAALGSYLGAAEDAARVDGERAVADVLISECLYNPIPRGTIGVPYGDPAIQGWYFHVWSTAWEDVWLDA